MDNLALIESFGDFKDEKGISKIDLMAIIEDSLKTLLKKRYDSDDHFDVIEKNSPYIRSGRGVYPRNPIGTIGEKKYLDIETDFGNKITRA